MFFFHDPENISNGIMDFPSTQRMRETELWESKPESIAFIKNENDTASRQHRPKCICFFWNLVIECIQVYSSDTFEEELVVTL